MATSLVVDQDGSEWRETALIRHQMSYVKSQSAWLLGDGGRGSGKSFALCCKLVSRAAHVGAREGLFRQRLIDIKGTTLKTLLEGDGQNPPVLLPGAYSHNESKKVIKLHGGGEIVYNGMDQGEVGRQMGSTGKGSSLNLSGAAFDEWVEMEEASVLQVTMGVRVKVDGIPLQRYGVCNPSTPMHWLAKRFGIVDKDHQHPRASRVEMPARLNTFNPPEFLEELESLEGVARMRYYLGLWVGADGLVYDRFLRSTHLRDWETPQRFKKGQVIGVDDGYTHPFVVLDIGIDRDGRKWLRNEVYESLLTETEKIERVKSLWDGESTVVVDSASPDLIEAMRRAGINAEGADKGPGSINYGINIVQTELATESDDGVYGLTISPNCTNTVRELESYEWKPTFGAGMKEQPRDQNNHAMDALRYAIRYIHEERGGRVLSSSKQEASEGSKSFKQLREDPDWGF